MIIPKGDTLVTYYLLPLMHLSKSTFGKKFKTAYVSKSSESLRVFIELKSNMLSTAYKENPHFQYSIVLQAKPFLVFKMPEKFQREYKLFIEGSYSKFSKEAKNIIYKLSGLPFNKKMGSFAVSHPVLQALDKTKTLRTFLVDLIGLVPNYNAELIDAPHDWWFIENKLKTNT